MELIELIEGVLVASVELIELPTHSFVFVINSVKLAFGFLVHQVKSIHLALKLESSEYFFFQVNSDL